MKTVDKIPARTIERMVLYKRLLTEIQSKGSKTIFSHELSELAHNTSAQVRRDFMMIGQEGGPHKGYDISSLLTRITEILGKNNECSVALIGVGNLGRAILSYFTYRHSGVKIAAAFDSSPEKAGRVISGCRCYSVEELAEKIKELGITIAVITVPATHAQAVADTLVAAGIRGILNFAPIPLKLPETVVSERIDIASALEKLAYFSEGK